MRNSDGTKNAFRVTPYNPRGLHEISTRHTNTEGDLGMDFPEGTVFTFYSVLEESCHNAETAILSPACMRNMRSQLFCLAFPCLLFCLFTQALDLKTKPYDQKAMTTWRPMESPQLHCAKWPISNLHPPSIHHVSHLSNADGSHQIIPRLSTY